jgi:hypothetical protein
VLFQIALQIVNSELTVLLKNISSIMDETNEELLVEIFEHLLNDRGLKKKKTN